MEKIKDVNEFKQLLEKEESFFLLKHSTTCPISAAAFEEFNSFFNDSAAGQKGVYLAVQESRELSNHIAEASGIRHESPQVILFSQGKPKWHESHWNITKDQLNSVR